MSHYARQVPGSERWLVGHYDDAKQWYQLSEHDTLGDAADACNYLNGGIRPLTKEEAEDLAEQVMGKLLPHNPNLLDQVGQERSKGAALRELVAELIRRWDSTHVYGFACADQSNVPRLMELFKLIRQALRG